MRMLRDCFPISALLLSVSQLSRVGNPTAIRMLEELLHCLHHDMLRVKIVLLTAPARSSV